MLVTMRRVRGVEVMGVVVGLVLGLIALSPAPAWACIPKRPDGLYVERPAWTGESGPVLVDEHIEIVCERARPRVRCHWRGHYVYEGGGGPVDGELALESMGELLALHIAVDGVELPAPLHDGSPSQALHAEDGAHVEVEIEIEVSLDSEYVNGCAGSVGYVRHPQVSRLEHEVGFVVSNRDLEVAESGRTRLRAQPPKGWRVEIGGGPRPRRGSFEANVDSREHRSLWMRKPPVYHGPFVAGGVGFGPQIRARLRAGYELSAPDFMVYSAAVEGDAVEELLVVPAIEAALPSVWLIFPSVGVGVGAPVMVLPQARPGVRVQLTAGWLYAAIVGSVDVYPAFAGAGRTLRGALMLQLSI